MAKYKKGQLKGIETHADIFEKIGGASGGARSKLKIKKKKEQEVDESPRDPRITEKFLKEHGYQEATTLHGRKQQTFVELNDKGKYRIYTGWTRGHNWDGKGKGQGVSQTTLNNPSLKELMIWMGY